MSLTISKEAVQVLEKLVSKLNGSDHIKIDNNKPDSGIMPVCVEVIQTFDKWRKVISVAHYYEQNGDLMADPLMDFLRVEYGGEISYYPLRFKVDGVLATDRDSLILDEKGVPQKVARKWAYEDRVFTTQWMKNIKWQQSL